MPPAMTEQKSLWFPVCIHCHQPITDPDEARQAWRVTTDVNGNVVKNELLGSFHTGCGKLLGKSRP